MPLAQSWVDVFTCIAVCFAGYLSIRQWRNTLKIQRAKFLSELVAKLHSKEFLQVVYLFDYDCDWYNESFHNSTKNKDRNDSDESQVDNYLSWLAYLCHLFSTGCIDSNEMDVFAYEIKRVLTNAQVRDYMYNVHHFSKANKRESPFFELEAYAEKEKLICGEVFANSSLHESDKRFHKYLSW